MKKTLSLIVAAALVAVGCGEENPLSSENAPPAAKLTVSSTTAGGIYNPRPVNDSGLTVSDTPTGGLIEDQTKPTQHFTVSDHRAGDGRPTPGKPLIDTVRGLLHFDEVLQLDGLELTWLEIQDSRCPEGVNCITAGKVDIVLNAKSRDKDLGNFDLSLDPGQKDQALALVGGYTVALLAVDPYPVDGVETQRGDYSAMILVQLPPPPRNVTTSGEEAGGGLPGEDFGGSGEHPEVAAALAVNRAKWEEAALGAYTFNQQRICFCLPEFRQQATIEVADGLIQSAHYVDSGEAVTDAFDFYLSAEQLFALIDDALSRQADNIEVEFDSQLGYPRHLFIDYDFRMADEEVTYESENVVAF